jgi:hypothetical protein
MPVSKKLTATKQLITTDYKKPLLDCHLKIQQHGQSNARVNATELLSLHWCNE